MKHLARTVLLFWCTVMTASSWATFEDGLSAYNTGDYATALKKWRPLARQGDADAQNSLGVAYENGKGVEQNFAEAVKLYTRSANQGNEAAQFNLGRMYAKGRGVKKSEIKAVYWYSKAAEQGNAAAQNNLGLAYANGRGVKRDDIEAVRWFTQAAEQGQADAQSNLAWMYAHGQGVTKNIEEATKWSAQATAQFAPNADQNKGTAAQAQSGKQAMPPGATRSIPIRKAGRLFRDCTTCPEMRVIHAGSFDMGSPASEAGHEYNESPVHRVNVASFALGKTEITRGQFAEFVKQSKYSTGGKCWTLVGGKFAEHNGDWRKPGYPQDDRHPVTCINWEDAQAYAKWLSRKTGEKYRLPTEAEWEYAARSDTGTSRYWGDDPDAACVYANAADRTARAKIVGATSWSTHDCTDGYAYTSPAGTFMANTFGLNDMLGNLWEWTEDGYAENYERTPVDGSAWKMIGTKRVLRGGSWNNSPQNVRAAARNKNEPELRFSIFGFRIARELP